MLLIQGGEDQERSPAEMQAIVQEYIVWVRRLREANRMLDGDELDSQVTMVRQSANGIQATDGPYAETKEAVGGYFLIEAVSRGQAIEIAKECSGLQHGGAVEVRGIVDHSQS